MKSGTGPTQIDHRDYDFHRSFGSAVNALASLPDYTTDAGLTMPNQNEINEQFSPPVPALPYGCTSYTTSELAIDLGVPPTLVNPLLIENVTQANIRGGYDLRQALLVGVKLKLFTGIFNIRAYGQDMFDAVRTAQVAGGTEKRSVAVGSEWEPIFEQVSNDGLLATPKNFNDPNITWHAWKICGQKTINGQLYLIGKSLQGPKYGFKGLCYFSRPLFNQLMSVPGSVAFTATRGELPPIQTISTTWLQWLISYARNLLPY